MSQGGLTLGRLLAYGSPGLPLAALGLPLYVFIPTFYTDGLGMGLTAVGVALILARGLDVLTDPAVGLISDRLQRPWYRRKTVILTGLPLLMLGVYRLFMPPAEVDFLYLLIWTSVVYLGWTLITLPYTAWGAELSGDYHERSRVTGFREGFVILGTLAAAAAPALSGSDGDLREPLRLLTMALLILMPVTLALALLRVPEPRDYAPPVPWRNGIALLRDNRPFLRLLLAYLLNSMANALPATLFLLFVTHRLEAEAAAGPLLIVYFLAGIAGLPLWLAVSRRLGKHRAWSLSMLWASAIFLCVPLVGPGDLWAFGVICLLSGLSLGVDMALPAAIQADVVDLDRARGGGVRTGLFFGLWGMTTKLALALAVGVAFPALDLFGFQADGPNDAVAIGALVFLYALLPVAIKLIALTLVWTFPLDQAEQQRLRSQLSSQHEGEVRYANHDAGSPAARAVGNGV